jgi:hypothetical protein
MAVIINASIDLTKIDKSKIIQGEKGKYLNLSIIVNDESNKFGQNVSVSHNQSKEEREAKAPITYLGNGKVVWNNGKVENAVKPNQNETTQQTQSDSPEDDDLPF